MMIHSFLKAVLGNARIGLVDIGASGGLEPRWRRHSTLVTAFFFEPDQRALARLEIGSGSSNPKIYPFALAETDGLVTLNLCAKQAVSSVLRPNLDYLARFPDVERFDIVGQVEVPAHALDSCLSSEEALTVDFFKIDTQGSELLVLQGAQRVLATPVIGLEVEVEFQELYENQPLFGQLCSELKKHGFELFDFTSICRWNRRGFSRFGQLAFADALFLRSPEYFADLISTYPESIRREKCLKYFAICALYNRVDLLSAAQNKFAASLTPADLQSIRKRAQLFAIRDGILSKIFGAVFRIIFRPLGFNFLPVSYEAPNL